ncbi:MAG: pilus assembly protein [Candidatus Thiodiazotropha sp. (ex Lucinoma borealis)]|nr:pilus assembly protein [Candidatus Thiodiazotropha sp. (ex Troendleina suluensis)]MCU7863645.1 pilus assembly protein [Candidatus Thiodiazotropha sp. (ex Lucinoma borealis)]
MFIKSNQSSRRTHFGQGMTEYIIIVAVIAVAAIGAFGYFGQIVETQIAGVGQELGGNSGAAARGAAGGLGDAAETLATESANSMTNYHENDSEAASLGN